MADTTVDETHAEVVSALETHAPMTEGLQDFSRLNLQESTKNVILKAIADYARRQQLLEAAEVALRQLLDDGYPELPVREIEPNTFDDLQGQAVSIAAALAKFAPIIAKTLNMVAHPVEPKA